MTRHGALVRCTASQASSHQLASPLLATCQIPGTPLSAPFPSTAYARRILYDATSSAKLGDPT